jgi:hypothetical protein
VSVDIHEQLRLKDMGSFPPNPWTIMAEYDAECRAGDRETLFPKGN